MSAAGLSLWRALAEAGAVLATSAPWILQCFVGLVVAFIALPVIRDIAARGNTTAAILTIAREALDVGASQDWRVLRSRVPGVEPDIVLRRLGGVLAQLMAVVTLIVWIVTLAAWAWTVATPEAGVDEVDTVGTILVAPFVIALGVYAGFMRVEPPAHRPRVMLAMLLDEEILGERAVAHSSSYSARSARVVLWTLRIALPITLAACWTISLFILTGSSSQPIESPWWQVVFTAFLLALVIGLVCAIPDLLLTGITWSRFWIGGWAGATMLAVLGAGLVGFVAYELGAIVAAFREDNGAFAWTLITILAFMAIAHGIPAVAQSRSWSAWLPGYGNLALIAENRAAVIARYRKQLEAMTGSYTAEVAEPSA
jgi:hypothetical protein